MYSRLQGIEAKYYISILQDTIEIRRITYAQI